MTLPDLPWSEPVRLHQVGGGVKRTLEPDAAARARIVKALDLASLDAFTAEMELKPTDAGWRLSGRVRASLAQTCGITLEPLPLEIDAPFALTLAEAVEEDSDEIVITLDDESPDLIENGQIDLGQYAVEQLALRLDPFPRKPGAEFVQPPEPAEISPFAVLKQLRPSDEG
ncbi:MAG: DUF177 domain-containing protein [Alphaproteobacteria bacterium]|jgi:uncharacterized metal-binding protein YceD (DUF177 family)|nr:DUF177 domain-containing protein [Alphaproteobacteria bacterium]MBU2042380.1 DUF177 domain-containing protein [Alphaproteobacteria bacterium]MBU2125557.1 DUF177 domain-containing protein [Alphaproteobacteria bacterium]MBU2209403.1 DUF177 domain-containing protein [Alphaproteobacteria bacterium]MBU2291489.1 DUF177 domain-containing protein [Alphaproteobacteria bacterium]